MEAAIDRRRLTGSFCHVSGKDIRERARLFGGPAAIESALGRDSCITVELPIVERVPAPADRAESGDHEDQKRASR